MAARIAAAADLSLNFIGPLISSHLMVFNVKALTEVCKRNETPASDSDLLQMKSSLTSFGHAGGIIESRGMAQSKRGLLRPLPLIRLAEFDEYLTNSQSFNGVKRKPYGLCSHTK